LSQSIILTAIATARAEPSSDSEDGSRVPIITQLEILAALPKRMSLLQFFRPSLQRSDGRRWRSRKLPQSDGLRCAASTEVQSSDARASEVRALHVCARGRTRSSKALGGALARSRVALDQGCSMSGRLRQPARHAAQLHGGLCEQFGCCSRVQRTQHALRSSESRPCGFRGTQDFTARAVKTHVQTIS
jgi:hypothetical protein